ncbi:MAG: alpha-L-fucosidase, partial [Planctomycetota bacterium]
RHGAAPQWYRDAVFGIYYHWGVYSVPAFGGEKYPRDMYRENSATWKHHRATYGNPTEYGYHDFIPMFRAGKWDPDAWAELFRNAGADVAGSIAEHHDGFAMWDTDHNPFNAMDMGPRRDVVGEMARAVKRQGLKFITTFHHLRWDYYDAGRRLCPKGVGVNDPKLSGLYAPVHEPGDPKLGTWLIDGRIKRPKGHIGDPISEEYREQGFRKFIEVIDRYQPDHLQSDGGTLVRLGQENVRKVLAHFFNSAERRGAEVVVTRGYDSHHPYTPSEMWGKEVMVSRIIPLTCSVQNIERHFPKITLHQVSPDPWQTSTPVPGFAWGYVASQENKTPEEIERSANDLVDGIVDMKSKNGFTLLGVAPRADGTFPEAQVQVLNRLGAWMSINKEALRGSRPHVRCAAGTLRFTRKGEYLYAIDLATPRVPLEIPGVTPEAGSAIRMLGSDTDLAWHHDGTNLVIDELPDPLPCDYARVFKIRVSDAEDRAQRASGG